MVRQLRDAGLTPAYRRNLRESAEWLLQLVRSLGGRLSRASSSRDIDVWLERAVNAAFDKGEKLYRVTLGVLGLQRQLKLSGPLLRGTWSAIRGWRSLTPVRSRVPLTRYALDAIILVCLSEGYKEMGWNRQMWWGCGLALWLGFEALLRPGELCRLFVMDLSFPDALATGDLNAGLVVLVRRPKTRRIWREQFILIKNGPLIQWMAWWCRDRRRRDKLFPFTYHSWATLFKRVLCQLDLEALNYTLGSLRAGGATEHYRQHQDITQLQYHGRWHNVDSLRSYLHLAMSIHVAASAPQSAVENLATAHRFKRYLQRPPRTPLKILLQP